MAALSQADRKKILQDFCSDISAAGAVPGMIGTLNRAEMLAAVAGLDDWADANAAAINAAIPQPARGSLSVKAKAELLFRVLRRRYEVT